MEAYGIKKAAAEVLKNHKMQREKGEFTRLGPSKASQGFSIFRKQSCQLVEWIGKKLKLYIFKNSLRIIEAFKLKNSMLN